MKRYFLAPDGQLANLGGLSGEWHYIDLGSQGAAGVGHHAVVLCDPHVEPPAGWEPLPGLLDARTTMKTHGKRHHERLADCGVAADHTAHDAAVALARVHPKFRP